MIGTNPGELVLHSLLKQFASVCQNKVESALDEHAENDLLKCLCLQDDTAFQQLLNALYTCAEHALPSLLQTITKWYDTQHSSGALYPFRRSSIKTPAGVRSQTISAATGQQQAASAIGSGAAGGRDLLIRSMLVESSGGVYGNLPSDGSNPGLLTPASSTGQELAPASSWLNMSISAREYMAERRDLCIDILYCQALNAVLKQLPYHPGHDEMINKILDQAFRHFEYKENLQTKPNAENINAVADAYAKVVGELSQTRFNQVRHHFSTRLEQLRAKESNAHTMHSIISLLMGMKFFRVKMHPIEEFVAYFTFLHELGQYFLEVKEKEVRHALTCLFVEILLPVAAVVRHEVNIPALKNFVDLLYVPTFELAGKKKYALALFPMVTCLLCVGTKTFFLNNWPPFMSLCLSQLKNRDLGQVSVESLFRLLWVYVVRIKCEKHADTQNKLLSIVNGLFPKGSKSVLPKNVSSTVFVKIIHFIAQEKLDFAMTEIIFDLLGVNRLQKLVFTPERMNIGLRAFLLIAHGLQQKDGEPPMPQNAPLGGGGAYGTCSTSTYHRISAVGGGGVRRSFHGTTLDDALCERLGIRPYLVPVRKAFEAILRLLEPQIARSMMPPKLLLTVGPNAASSAVAAAAAAAVAEESGAAAEGEEAGPPPPPPSSAISPYRSFSFEESRGGADAWNANYLPLLARVEGDRKPKVDLLKTCINCIPRLLPYEMSRTELIELLARVSLNVDEEIRMMAQQTMVNLIIESPAYRQRTIQAFIQFIQKYVPDTAPHQLDNCLKTLHTLLVNWKIALQRDAASVTTSLAEKAALVEAEGFSLVMLCQCRPLPRRLAVHILRESRAVLKLINRAQQQQQQQQQSAQTSAEEPGGQTTSTGTAAATSTTTATATAASVAAASAASNVAVMDILDAMAPALVESVLPLLPISERNELTGVQIQDFRALSERAGPVWFCGTRPLSSWNHKPVLGPSNVVTSNPPVAAYIPKFGGSTGGLAATKVPTDPLPDRKSASTGRSASRNPSPMRRKSLLLQQEHQQSLSAADVAALRPSAFCQSLLAPYLLQAPLHHTRLTDVWGNVLAAILNTASPLSQHPALLHAWNIVFQRLAQVFTLIDPNAQAAENRASSLLRSTSKKAAPSERDQMVPLWHNYVTFAACIAPSSTGVAVVERNPPSYDASSTSITAAATTTASTPLLRRRPSAILGHVANPSMGSTDLAILASSQQSQPEVPATRPRPSHIPPQSHLSNNKLFIAAREKARDLVKLLVPLLRCCEHPELRESAVCALSRIQPAAFRDVLEDLHPVLREAGDAKMKNIQRRRRRDTLRLALIRVLALMAQNAVFQHDEAGIISNQGHLVPALFEFLEGTRGYLESINEPSAMVVTMFRSTKAPTSADLTAPANVSSSSAITAITSTPGMGGTGGASTANATSAVSGVGGGGGNSGGSAPTIASVGGGGLGSGGSGVGADGVASVGGGSGAGTAVAMATAAAQNASSVAAAAAATATTPSASAAASAAPAHAPTGVDPLVLLEMRLYFCVFIRDLIRHLPRERRLRFLPSTVRRNLVLLISRWTGFYEHMHHTNETEWVEAAWNQHIGPNYHGVAHVTPSTPTTGSGMDLVASGDLVLSISGVRLETTPQDTFISASFLDASVWLDLLWYANQAIAALVCCGALFDPLCIFTTLTEATESAAVVTASGHHYSHPGASTGTSGASGDTSQSALVATTSSASNVLTSAALVEEEASQMVTLNSVSLPATAPGYLVVQSGPGISQPPPGYIFHWLKGLLLCRDAKLSISPWLWGLPVVNFGMCSTALQGPHGNTRVSSIRLEDSLRSIVIAAAAGRRLDSLLRQLGEETLVLLLDMNPDAPGLMELLVDQCYTGSLSAIQAFIVIITQHFIRHPNTRCDKFALLTLTMVFCEHPLPTVKEHATFLLQTLYYRFFLLQSRELHRKMHPDCEEQAVTTATAVTSTPLSTATAAATTVDHDGLGDDHSELCLSALANELLWREIGHWEPSDVLRQFCAQHPTCTLPMISEICRRLATASGEVRCRLIKLLHYWTINIELVDLFSRGYSHTSCSFGFHEVISTTTTLQPTTTTISGNIGPSSESEAEAAAVEGEEEATVGAQEPEEAPRHHSSSVSSDFCSSVPSSVSSESDGSSVSTGSTSNIDLSDCDADVPTTTASKKATPPRRLRQTQHDMRRRNRQRRVSDQSLKPEGEKTKANELWASVPLTLRRSGWGCLKATEMVLNNFFYLTIRFANGNDEAAVLEELWVLLIRYRPQNLRFILRYLIVAASLAPATLCSHVNRVVSFLANENPSGVVDVLMAELQTIDGAGLMIEPSPLPPFFEITLLSDLTEAAAAGTFEASGQTAGPGVFVQRRPRRSNLSESTSFCQKDNDASSLFSEQADASKSATRPLSECISGGMANAATSQAVEPSTASTATSAISRLTNRFTSSASAIGRRALRTALHPGSGGGRTHKASVNLDQDQLHELDIDSLDGEGEDEGSTGVPFGGGGGGAETMPTPQNHVVPPSHQALVSARSQTLPYTAASRERYNRQAVAGMDASTSAVAPINRTSRFRKILSRRRATTGAGGSGDKESRTSTTGGRRNPFRSIFRSGGGGGGGGGGAISTPHTAATVVTSTDFVEVASTSARLFTTSLPPNLATLQPLPLPLHSHSISHLNDYRKKGRRGGRRLSATHKRRGHRRHRVRGRKSSFSGVNCSHVGLGAPYSGVGSGSLVLLQQPLPMPKEGSVYHAPMREWFTEPFVSNGSLVYSGMWAPTGARSPLVLVLVGEILKSHNRCRVAWKGHMPLLLLCLFLGLDHCRPLVQEASKQLLVNMLRVICPRIDLLRLLALQLETEAHWLPGAMAGFSDRAPQFCLTLEGGPSVPRFQLPVPTDTALRDVCSCANWVACCCSVDYSASLSSTAAAALLDASGGSGGTTTAPAATTGPPALPSSPGGLSPLTSDPPPISSVTLSRPSLLPQGRPNYLFGSTYSLMSTATLIPVAPSAPTAIANASKSSTGKSETPGEAKKSGSLPIPDEAVATAVSAPTVGAVHDCTAGHLHLAAEKIAQMLLEVQDRSVWTWEDITPSRFQQATLLFIRSAFPPSLASTSTTAAASGTLTRRSSSASSSLFTSHLLLRSARFLDRFVRCVASALAEAETGGRCEEAAICLRCHHGEPHSHASSGDTSTGDSLDCTVTRFALAAFNMGITCPNRHYAARSLQIYRALEAQLSEKCLSEILIRLVESLSEPSEEVQSYMVELFLTLETAVEHIRLRGTVLPPAGSGLSTRNSQHSRKGPPDSPKLPPVPTTPPVHERRHSRRGSSSSLSSMLIHPAAANGSAGASGVSSGGVGGVPVGGTVVPPIKRPLMPPHAEAVGEETETTIKDTNVNDADNTVIGPLKPSPGVTRTPEAESRIRRDSQDVQLAEALAAGTCRLASEEQADLLSGIFWIGVCLLDSDYEYEYLAGARLLSRLLPPCISTPASTELHDHVFKLLHRLKWTTNDDHSCEFPGLLGLLLKGCFSPSLIDTASRLLVHLIPLVKSPIVDPWSVESRHYRRATIGGSGARPMSSTASSAYPGNLPTLLLALLPLLLTAWDEDPDTTSSEGETCETCGGESGLSHALISGSCVGSWVQRAVVGTESAVPAPSSGLLSLLTANVVSGAVAKKAPQLRPRNPICILAAEHLADLAVQVEAHRYSNLALVLRMYASGTFSKDVNQWARCVSRYLMDGCGPTHAPRILAFLTAYLTMGPACVQLPLLHFGYWFLQAVELNQSDMSTRIRIFINATSERFVNTPLWPEVTLLYQVVVSRSATLTAAPGNPALNPSAITSAAPGGTSDLILPGLDPSGSGRVLDSLAAAAAAAVPLPESEPQRISLAGRVLDFDTTVLQSAPLIGGGKGQHLHQQQQQQLPTSRNEPIAAALFFPLGSWKTPWNRQTRIRGLFTNLLNCYGSQLEHLTAPRSPSNSSRQKVIFSQSTETLDRQLSMHSSSETTSINDASNPDDGNLDDTSSAERAAVFHDLDTYLDAQLMNINFLDLPDGNWDDQSRYTWGVRGHSIPSHSEFQEDGDADSQHNQREQQPPLQSQTHQQLHKPPPSIPPSFEEAGAGGDSTSLAGPSVPFTEELDADVDGEELEVDVDDNDEEEEEEDDDEEDEMVIAEVVDPTASGGGRFQKLPPISGTLLAPSATRRAFNSQLLVAWNSREDDLASGKHVVNRGGSSDALVPSLDARRRAQSMQQPVIYSRRRRQDQVPPARLGGSLDHLNQSSQPTLFKRNHSGAVAPPVSRPATSNSTVSSATSASAAVSPPPPPVKPPRRRARPARRSLELGAHSSRENPPPLLPLRASKSSGALTYGGATEVFKTGSEKIATDQVTTRTPAETAWMSSQRQLKSMVQQRTMAVSGGGSSSGSATSAESDRLRLVLTGTRGVFAGMLDRTTVAAVELANAAFSRCPPSSDLDPEIKISNLVKIAKVMRATLPAPFFSIHPDSVHLVDEAAVSQCLDLASVYKDWEDAVQRLSSTCAPTSSVDWQQHERICRNLQAILQRFLVFYHHCTKFLTTLQRRLVTSAGLPDLTDSRIAPIFTRLRLHLSTLPLAPTALAPGGNYEGIDAWKSQCADLLLKNASSPDVDDVKRALAVYADSMKLTEPLSMEDVMTIVEACCEQLWSESSISSGVALLFAHAEGDEGKGARHLEVSASISTKEKIPFFPDEDVPLTHSSSDLSPMDLADRIMHLLEV